MDHQLNSRRKFIRSSAIAATFLGIAPDRMSRSAIERKLEDLTSTPQARGKSVMGLKKAPLDQVKVGMIGLGNRGSFHAKLVHALYPKAKLTAICDIRPEYAQKTADFLKENGQNPAVYTGNADAWKEMVKRDDIDLVIVVTPWENHVPMCVEAMRQGKHVATEVPAAVTLAEHWEMVDTAEETQLNCMMMENVCYGDEELWLLNMAEQGVLGTLTYGECAYIHNLRDSMLSKTGYYNQWRIRHHVTTDGNLYPTHGLGPVAQYMGIGRGDRFDHLVSMSSLQASLSEASRSIEPDNEFYNRTDYAHGDMNTSLIKTDKGRLITVHHDVVTPRPYNRINALAGTKGYHEGYPSRLSILGKEEHDWLPEEEYKKYREQYKHPIWDKLKAEIEKNGGHGGMDFVMMYRLIDNLHQGLPLDMDVYDAAVWSGVTPISAISVQLGSSPVQFPDFTRGHWQGNRKLSIMESV